MATSGTFLFNPTIQTLINGILRALRITQEGVTAGSYDIANVTEAIDYLLKAWCDQGIPIWCKEEHTVVLLPNQATYTVGPGMQINISNPVDVLQVRYYQNLGAVETMLTAMSRTDYQSFSVKASKGRATSWYYQKNVGSGVLKLYPVPVPLDPLDAIIIDTQRYLQDAGTSLNTLDLPTQWSRALKWGVCAELLSEYEQPSERVQYIMAMAKDSLDLARSNAGEVASLFLYPDTRGESDGYCG